MFSCALISLSFSICAFTSLKDSLDFLNNCVSRLVSPGLLSGAALTQESSRVRPFCMHVLLGMATFWKRGCNIKVQSVFAFSFVLKSIRSITRYIQTMDFSRLALPLPKMILNSLDQCSCFRNWSHRIRKVFDKTYFLASPRFTSNDHST
jgi:hypothetical protein